MNEEFAREALLIGEDALKKLNTASVALFGVGGVGSYAAEALARSGVGKIMLVDNDVVSVSNINRQLCALHSTVGRLKAEVVAERLRDINPSIEVTVRCEFVLPENIDTFELSRFDYVIDAVDTVSAKLAIAQTCNEAGVAMISCMGTGNKLDPCAIEVTDISKTSVCPLARVMRRELKSRGIAHLPVVFSTEEPISPTEPLYSDNGKKIPASIAFVPSVAGLVAASEAVKYIIREADNGKA